ncbi:MAG TPA: hypothetical protein VMA74_16020 [Dyella sp.]|uniref:hypothetical protein n=1 Tax=Dyella sp. TaxID=1869338 RepID=UPI002C21B285|nr:hypothetical protein [Dyella sp.]HUB91232.1 hypothetical protein [Dyella sp.]
MRVLIADGSKLARIPGSFWESWPVAAAMASSSCSAAATGALASLSNSRIDHVKTVLRLYKVICDAEVIQVIEKHPRIELSEVMQT